VKNFNKNNLYLINFFSGQKKKKMVDGLVSLHCPGLRQGQASLREDCPRSLVNDFFLPIINFTEEISVIKIYSIMHFVDKKDNQQQYYITNYSLKVDILIYLEQNISKN
jgi:hypothetical protein